MNTCDLCVRDAMKVCDEINDKSEAFDEYVAKRCDEIASNDPTYKKLMDKAIAANKFLWKAVRDFENATAALQAYSEKLMLQSSLEDCTAQNTAQKIINHD